MDGELGGSTHQIVSVVLKIGIHKMKGKREVGVAGGREKWREAERVVRGRRGERTKNIK